MVKDTIDDRINHPRHGVRSTPFITVSDLQKVEKLIRAITASKGKRKQKIVEQGGAGSKRKYSEANSGANGSGDPPAETTTDQNSPNDEDTVPMSRPETEVRPTKCLFS